MVIHSAYIRGSAVRFCQGVPNRKEVFMYCISPYDNQTRFPIEIKFPQKQFCRIFTKEKGIIFSHADITGLYIGNCTNLSDNRTDIVFRFFIDKYDIETCILDDTSYWKVMIGD